MIATLAFFKVLMYRTQTDILADYFYFKAIAMVVFFISRIGFSDIAYILKTSIQSNYKSVIGLLILTYGVFCTALIILFILLLFLEIEFILLIFVAYTFYIMNDSIESFINVSRLFYKYKIILYYRIAHLFKAALFIFIPGSDLNIFNILAFEVVFVAFLFVIIILTNFQHINKKLKTEFFYLLNNKNALYSGWFQSVGKITYDALPQVLLANVVSDNIFVEYNIARKLLGIFNNAVQPLLQVFVTESAKYKLSFDIFVKKYLKIILPFCIMSLLIITTNYQLIIGILAKEQYAVELVRNLIIISFSLFSLHLCLYPIKQYLLLHNKYKNLTIGFFSSSLLMALISYISILKIGVFAAVFIQGIGLSLPLIIAYLLYYFEENKSSN
jgi:hypothetical protein